MPPHSRRRRGSHDISSVTQAHEQRLEHWRPQDLRPKLTNDRPLCVLGRLYLLYASLTIPLAYCYSKSF
jgi:hypothetical protein